jgi:hypothetical protein
VNRWRLLLGQGKFCDYDRNNVVESTGGDEFIEIQFVLDSAIVLLDKH